MTDESRFRAQPRAHGLAQPVPQGTGGRSLRRSDDPLAELARLIGQEDPFADFIATKPANERRRAGAESYRPRPIEPRHDDRDSYAHDARGKNGHSPAYGEDEYDDPYQDHRSASPNGAQRYREDDSDGHDLNGNHHDRPVANGRSGPRHDDYFEDDYGQPAASKGRFSRSAHDEFDALERELHQDQPQNGARRDRASQNGHYDARDGYAQNGYANGDHYDDNQYADQYAYESPQAKRAPAKTPQRRENGYDQNYAARGKLPAQTENLYEEAPQKSGKNWLLIGGASVCILILAGTGVFAYRTIFGGTGAPKTIKAESSPAKVAATSEPGKNNDRVGFENPPQFGERMQSREEEPIGRATAPGTSPFAPPPQAGQASRQTQAPAPAASEGEPKRVRTVSVRADGSVVGDQRANAQPRSGSNAPMSINSYAERDGASGPAQQAIPASPQARTQQSSTAAPSSGNPWANTQRPAAGQQQASVQPSAPPPVQRAPAPAVAVQTPPPAGSYVVQVASQKTEQEAQSAWQQVQSRFASVLGGQQATIRRVNLGDRGTFYRAQLGPYNDRARASEICENLKAEGGECIIQRN